MHREPEAKPQKFNYKLDKVPRGFPGSNSCRLKGLPKDAKVYVPPPFSGMAFAP